MRMGRALFLSAAATFILGYFPYLTNWISSDLTFYDQVIISWLNFLIPVVPGILFAITCHRLVLMGDQGVPDYGLLKWTQRETRYLGWFIAIIFICGLSYGVINGLIVSNTIDDGDTGVLIDTTNPDGLLSYLAYIPILYIFSRLSVLYPATAVDQQWSLKWAWGLSINNGWRLTLVVGGLPWVLYFFEDFLYRENATFVEYIILCLLGFILLAVEIVALSFSYKHLTEHVAPPASGL